MDKIFKFIIKQDIISLLALGSILANAILVSSFLAIFYNQLPSKLPLFYSLPWGEAQLVAKQQFLILPAVLILMGLINGFLAYQLHPAHLVLKKIIMGSLLLISSIILITAIRILIIFI